MSGTLLKGDTALVTGAASGIGRGIAQALAQEGARVVLADIDAERGESIAAALKKDGHDARFIASDLATADGPADLPPPRWPWVVGVTAIVAAIADPTPEKELITRPGTWARTLHEQWVFFALTEMESWLTFAEYNTLDFVLPVEQHVPAILPQTRMFFKRSAAALDTVLADTPFLVEGRFTVTDIIVGYTVNWGAEQGWIDDCPNLIAYLKRLYGRELCPYRRYVE